MKEAGGCVLLSIGLGVGDSEGRGDGGSVSELDGWSVGAVLLPLV